MATVHIFASVGRFASFEQLRAFIDPTYTEDGDAIPSVFIREVQLTEFDPSCIEAIFSKRTVPLVKLLEGASYCDQWLSRLPRNSQANAAICVFEPNLVQKPFDGSLEYCGAFTYIP